jgi:hypothetical protein
MDFWKSQPRDEEEDDRPPETEPTFFEKLADFAKDEAMAAAVEHLSGGWVTLENDDEEEPRPRSSRNQDSFEERLQRELAKLAGQSDEVPPTIAPDADIPANDTPAALPPAPAEYRPVSRPTPQGPRGFGRKGL